MRASDPPHIAMLVQCLKGLFLIILPPLVFMIASWTLNELSNRNAIRATLGSNHPLRCPLNMRFKGYKPETAMRYFEAIRTTPGAMEAERRFLKLDLWLPIVLGAALFACFLWVRE